MTFRYILILLLLGTLVSCVEEPTMEPAQTPFSIIRLGNFSENVDALKITIDGDKSFTVNKGELTDYFELVAGNRQFEVVNTANSETLISRGIDITSYEEVNVLFTGYSAPGDEFNNTFSNLNFTEGFVYLLEGPDDPNRVWVRFFNFISPTPDYDSPDIQVETYNVEGDSANTTSAFAYNEYRGVALDQGAHAFSVLNEDATDTLSTLDQTVNSGTDYFVFVVGPDSIPNFYVNSRNPLEVRSK